ncbi:MAG: ornithine carbamoyltransferase [Acidimicrobiaceae bacterium]|jgi:ornithine carbamoyltransferase|nr:ornithine carbamoyltransferase [Acidimicrobiaceae bacterium]
MRHFLEVDDLAPDELAHVLELAQLTPAPAVLTGRGVALIFEKPSSRTRNSSELAVFQLGGHPLTIRGEEVGFDRRESVEDVTLTLAQYHAAIGARVFDHKILERMAAVSPVPVVNLLSDLAHPCQGLADVLTLQQHFGGLSGLKVAWVGDGSNVCRSLLLAASLAGISFAAACPAGFEPDRGAVERARGRGVDVLVTGDVAEAVRGADAVCTDTWISMGQEAEEAGRRSAFRGFTVDPLVMAQAAPGAVFLHCLPAHRGEEVTGDVIDGPQSLVWPQAANRMHAFRGLLLSLFGSVL